MAKAARMTPPRLDPAFALPLDQVNEQLDSSRAVVEAGNVAELLTAMRAEDFLVLLGDLLERLDAIGGKAGRDDGDAFDPRPRQALHRLIGVRLDPFGAATPRLEGKLDLRAERPECGAQRFHGRDALLLVGIALLDIVLGYAVEGGEDRFGLEIERRKMRLYRLGERGDIDRVFRVRRHGAKCGLNP